MSSTITVPSPDNFPPSISASLIAVATAAKADIDAIELGGVATATKSALGVVTNRRVRGVVTANIASLAAFTGVTGGSAFDTGVTCVAGDVVLLVGQSTAAQNGPYVVGTVATGAAPLTRPADWATGAAVELGAVYEVGSEGTLYGGSTWKAMATGAPVVGTDDPLFYPKHCKGVATLAGNPSVKAIGSAEGLFLFSTTKSIIQLTLNTAGGTLGTWGLAAPVANRTAGKLATGAFTIASLVDAGTGATSDTSTVDWLVTNW